MSGADHKSMINIKNNEIYILDIPQSTKEFLTENGLPKSSVLHVSFTAENGTFPTLNAYCQLRNLHLLKNGELFYRIGTDEGSQICLTNGNGEVVAIDPSGNHEQRFVNSSIELFLRFLDIYSFYSANVQINSDDEANSLTKQVIAEMQRADPHAFSDPDSWWASIAQQMEFGML